jgi:hypothetical protein
MKRFIAKFVVFLLILVAPVLVSYYLYINTAYEFISEYSVKRKLLQTVESPRIVFVSGSNLMYGLDSKRISDSLHVNVVNNALALGVGLRYMVDDVAQYLRTGDILVIAPEYHNFFSASDGDDTGILTGVVEQSHLKNWLVLNDRQKTNVLSGFCGPLKARVQSWLENSKGVGRKLEFNEYGDEIGHWKFDNDTIFDSSYPINDDINSEFMDYFVGRLNEISKQGVKVVVVPPIALEKSYKVWKNNAEEVSSYLKEKGYPFLVATTEHVLDDKYNYGHPYHVTKPGVDIITGKIIAELRPFVAASQGRVGNK